MALYKICHYYYYYFFHRQVQLAYFFTSLLSLFVKVYFDEVKVPVENVLGGKRKSGCFILALATN